MSTIKSSAENLTLNADGANNDIIFQSNGSEVASIDQAGVMTATSFAGSGASLTALPAANLTGTLPAIDGSALTNLPAGGKVIGHSITYDSSGFYTTSTTNSTVLSASYTPVSASSTIVVKALFTGYLEGNVNAQGLKGGIYRDSTLISGVNNWIMYDSQDSGWLNFMAAQVVTGVSTGHSASSYTWALEAAISGGGEAFSTYTGHQYIQITEYS